MAGAARLPASGLGGARLPALPEDGELAGAPLGQAHALVYTRTWPALNPLVPSV